MDFLWYAFPRLWPELGIDAFFTIILWNMFFFCFVWVGLSRVFQNNFELFAIILNVCLKLLNF